MQFSNENSQNFIETINSNKQKTVLIRVIFSILASIILFILIRPIWSYNIYITTDEQNNQIVKRELRFYRALFTSIFLFIIIYFYLTYC
jgi:hypothetical protein